MYIPKLSNCKRVYDNISMTAQIEMTTNNYILTPYFLNITTCLYELK